MSTSFSSNQSQIQPPDLSLGSLNSSLGTGIASSSALPNLTQTRRPSGLSTAFSSSDKIDHFDPTHTPVGTPGGTFGLAGQHKRRKSSVNVPLAGAPTASGNAGRQSIGGVNLTLREQEKVIDSLKKENFSLKLKVHFLEERLQENNPEHVELALRQNINLKIEVQSRGVEIKRLKKQVKELEAQATSGGDRSHHSIRDRPDSVATGTTAYSERERELEMLLEERDKELREYRRRKGGVDGKGGLAVAQDELEEARALLEENIDAMERLRDECEVLREEKEDLLDQLDGARLELEAHERDAERERSASRLGDYEREQTVEELNSLKDKLAATEIELQTKEEELEARDGEFEAIEQEWRQEVAEARGQMEDLRDANAELEQQVTDLRQTLSERETELDNLRAEFEDLENAAHAVHAELEQLAAAAEELEAANEEIKRLGERVFELEDELEVAQRGLEDAKADLEREVNVVGVLKDKIAALKDQLAEVEEEADQNREAALAHKAREDELAGHAQELAAEVQALQGDVRNLEKELEREESARRRAEDERAAGQAALARSEASASDRFGLELDLEKQKRESSRLAADVARLQSELDALRDGLRAKEAELDNVMSSLRESAAREASNAQTRMNLSEKLDAALEKLKGAEKDRERAAELEARLGKDQRALLSAEGTFRDQISERNTLLLTVWSYLDKVLGAGATPKKTATGTTKPFTNFAVFNDGMLSRLKGLSTLHADFEKRVQATEAKLMDRLGEVKRTLDTRWRTLERVEGSVKNLVDAKASWRRKVALLQGELDGARATVAEMGSQVAAAQRRPGETAKDSEIRALTARATNAERRLANAQNQLAGAEERLASQSERVTLADGKWEARVKEYEARIKAAEERVKRERQGAKERVGELETSVKSLQRQVEIAKERQRRVDKTEG